MDVKKGAWHERLGPRSGNCVTRRSDPAYLMANAEAPPSFRLALRPPPPEGLVFLFIPGSAVFPRSRSRTAAAAFRDSDRYQRQKTADREQLTGAERSDNKQ